MEKVGLWNLELQSIFSNIKLEGVLFLYKHTNFLTNIPEVGKSKLNNKLAFKPPLPTFLIHLALNSS